MRRESIIANFNCTFGENDEKMLTYFEDIVYPAFTSDLKRINKAGDEYFFEKVQIIEYENGLYALAGFFVKKTILVVESGHDSNKGIYKDHKEIPSAPYSIFIIFLNNHRMILIKNQSKGSPDIRNFSSTIKEIFNKYIKAENKSKKKLNKLPNAYINVSPIPSEKSIEEQLKDIKTINNITLRFYPLNGDVDNTSVLKYLREELKDLNSKSGNLAINTPKNEKEIVKLIKDTKGTAVSTLKVTGFDGEKKTIRNEELSEKIYIETQDDNITIDDSKDILKKLNDREELKIVSKENNVIYLDKRREIIKISKGELNE